MASSASLSLEVRRCFLSMRRCTVARAPRKRRATSRGAVKKKDMVFGKGVVRAPVLRFACRAQLAGVWLLRAAVIPGAGRGVERRRLEAGEGQRLRHLVV